MLIYEGKGNLIKRLEDIVRGKVEILVGAGALNHAVKAVAIARGFLAPSGYSKVCIPAFVEIELKRELN